MSFVLRIFCVCVFGLSVACSRIEWAHSVSKSSVTVPDGGRNLAKWSDVCAVMGKSDTCDVCAEMGWYDDSTCDAFCPARDSACVVVDPSLVGHWKLDEESGRTAFDSSANGNNGTYVGMPTPQAGKFGKALEFHGPGAVQSSNDRITFGDPANANLDFGTSSFTYGLWVYVTAPAGDFDIPISKGAEGADLPGFNFELGTGVWKACVADGDAAYCGTFRSEPVLGRWVHLMAVMDRQVKTLQLYLDGNPILAVVSIPSTFGSVSSSNSLNIGAPANGRHAFKGFIDDVRLYNRALGPIEVFNLQQ